MTPRDRHDTGSTSGRVPWPFWLLGGLGSLDVALHAGVAVDGWRTSPTWNPIPLALDVGEGRVAWPFSASLVLGAMALVALAVALLAACRPGRRGRHRAAPLLGKRRDVRSRGVRGARRTADRLGVEAPGLPVARAVNGGAIVYATWEEVQVDVWGPRRGKTTSRAIPTLLAAPGAAFATTNKRDVHDATRLSRERVGRVWSLDPERLIGGEPEFWWDPLSFVTSFERAKQLADALAGATRKPEARGDAFFDPSGAALVANLLRAAALGRRPITDVLLWVADPDDPAPVTLLRAHGQPLAAEDVDAEAHAPHDQRAGVYATAKRLLGWLADPAISEWVTPPSEERVRLDLRDFVRSSDTLYLHSTEHGAAAPLVTAITAALCETAEAAAKASSHGRLATPLVGVIDEAANVVRWPALPSLFSHYGSRGICLIAILQGWSQGCIVWGEQQMAKLWSAANVNVYGGGVEEERFLSQLEKLIGDYQRPSVSSSSHGGRRSTTSQTTRQPILDVADLRALPAEHLVVLPSGSPPILCRALSWWDGPHAKEVAKSIDKYAPENASAG